MQKEFERHIVKAVIVAQDKFFNVLPRLSIERFGLFRWIGFVDFVGGFLCADLKEVALARERNRNMRNRLDDRVVEGLFRRGWCVRQGGTGDFLESGNRFRLSHEGRDSLGDDFAREQVLRVRFELRNQAEDFGNEEGELEIGEGILIVFELGYEAVVESVVVDEHA